MGKKVNLPYEKTNLLYGKIINLYKTLQEIQSDDSKIHEDVMEITKNK